MYGEVIDLILTTNTQSIPLWNSMFTPVHYHINNLHFLMNNFLKLNTS